MHAHAHIHAHRQAGDIDEEEGSDVSGSDTPSELLDDDDMYDDDDVRRREVEPAVIFKAETQTHYIQ